MQKLEQQADEVLRPFREAAERLTNPRGRETVARVLVAEIGVDMTRFPGPGHLVSWAGLCPRLDESPPLDPDPSRDAVAEDNAGPGRVGGNPEERELSADAVSTAQGRRGPKKAIVAVAASMLTAAYFMLRDETDYHDLGGRYLANRGTALPSASSAVCTTLEWRSK